MKTNSGASVERPASSLSGVKFTTSALPCDHALKLRVS